MYDTALFDIDGTLCDPGSGITDAVRHALADVGIAETNQDALRRFVGPPLEYSFRDYYALDDEQIDIAVTAYREHYGTEGISRYTVYPGIVETLRDLASAGVRLAVVTAKIQPFAEQALRSTGLRDHFELVAGRSPDEVVTKTITLRRAVATMLDRGARDLVMIGDREHDVHAARDNHIDSVGVLYGYGTRAELTTAGVTYLVDAPASLTTTVIGERHTSSS